MVKFILLVFEPYLLHIPNIQVTRANHIMYYTIHMLTTELDIYINIYYLSILCFTAQYNSMINYQKAYKISPKCKNKFKTVLIVLTCRFTSKEPSYMKYNILTKRATCTTLSATSHRIIINYGIVLLCVGSLAFPSMKKQN